MRLPTFSVVILAGGRSSRMGTDKAALPFKGRTLLDHMKATAAAAGAQAVLVGGGPHADLADPVTNGGPVASLCALAKYPSAGPKSERWVVIPVDMPRLGPDAVRRLAAAGSEAAFFSDNPLPLALTLHQTAIAVFAAFQERLRRGESAAVWQVLEALNAAALTPSPVEVHQLINTNTPDEWQRLLQEQT